MAIQSINPSDKLQSGFRGKYNETIEEIWVSATDNGDGTVTISKYGGGQVILSLGSSFFTKLQITQLLTGVNPATDETAGIIRIATPEEAIEGHIGDAAITPETLVYAMAANGIDVIVNAAAPQPEQAKLNIIYFRPTGEGIQIYVSRLYEGDDEDAPPFVWADRGTIALPGRSSTLNVSTDTTIDWQAGIAPDANGQPSGQTWAQRFGNGFVWTAEYQMPSGPYAGEFTDYRPTVLKSYSSGNLTQIRILDVMANTRIIFK